MVKDSKTGECYRADVCHSLSSSHIEAAGGEDGPAAEGHHAVEGAAPGAGPAPLGMPPGIPPGAAPPAAC